MIWRNAPERDTHERIIRAFDNSTLLRNLSRDITCTIIPPHTYSALFPRTTGYAYQHTRTAFIPDTTPGEICAATLHEIYHICDPENARREERAVLFEVVGGNELRRVDPELGEAALRATIRQYPQLRATLTQGDTGTLASQPECMYAHLHDLRMH